MAWTNAPLELFHGTDAASAHSILGSGVSLSYCSPLTDFGAGFYTTTNLTQARDWAIARATRAGRAPAVVGFAVDRTWLSRLEGLTFVQSGHATGYQDFVRYCRAGHAPHRPGGVDYEVVSGRVAIWPRRTATLLTFRRYDQFSFHTSKVILALNALWITPHGRIVP
ncbi:MAG: DUF3990 domain-containing protein [Deltaproteobacteria bacterium]|nr:DUF3990 domain-containing protein [Deltaproteobacteria bacterium]